MDFIMLINKLNFGLALKLHAVVAIRIDSQFSIIAMAGSYNIIYLKINFFFVNILYINNYFVS